MNQILRPPFQADLEADLKRVRERYNCRHVKLRIRKVVAASGQPMYRHQCIVCGQGVGGWIGHADLPRNQTFEEWDRSLSETWYDRQREEIQRVRLKYSDPSTEADYSSYLRSERWQAKRCAALRRANGVCEACGVHPPTEVHHLAYRNIGNEYLWEIAAVCSDCHDRIHPEKRGGV